MAETVHAMGSSKYNAKAFEHAWQKSVVDQSEPLQAWSLAQVVHHVAHGLRENTRQHQIFPESDTDQYRNPTAGERIAAINNHLAKGNFTESERAIVLERVRENAQRAASPLPENNTPNGAPDLQR